MLSDIRKRMEKDYVFDQSGDVVVSQDSDMDWLLAENERLNKTLDEIDKASKRLEIKINNIERTTNLLVEAKTQLEAEFEKLVRYVRAQDDYDFRKVKDEKAARVELEKAYSDLSDETRKAIENNAS